MCRRNYLPFHFTLFPNFKPARFLPNFLFYTPWKYQENQRFSAVFRGCKMRTLARNGLTHEKTMLASHRNYSVQQPVEVFNKKVVLKRFHKFTGKHLNFAKFLRTTILKNICERLLLSAICFFVLARFKATLVGYLNGNSDLWFE